MTQPHLFSMLLMALDAVSKAETRGKNGVSAYPLLVLDFSFYNELMGRAYVGFWPCCLVSRATLFLLIFNRASSSAGARERDKIA
jgi:hypothetical protein